MRSNKCDGKFKRLISQSGMSDAKGLFVGAGFRFALRDFIHIHISDIRGGWMPLALGISYTNTTLLPKYLYVQHRLTLALQATLILSRGLPCLNSKLSQLLCWRRLSNPIPILYDMN